MLCEIETKRKKVSKTENTKQKNCYFCSQIYLCIYKHYVCWEHHLQIII